MRRRNFLQAMVAALAMPEALAVAEGQSLTKWTPLPSPARRPCDELMLSYMLVQLDLERPIVFALMVRDGELVALVDNPNPETVNVEGQVMLRRIGDAMSEGRGGAGLYHVAAGYRVIGEKQSMLIPLEASFYLPIDAPPLTIRDPMKELARSSTWTVVA